MAIDSFKFARTPDIHFGAGTFKTIAQFASKYGTRALLVTGKSSFENSGKKDLLERQLAENHLSAAHVSIHTEPTPESIDAAVSSFRNKNLDLVIAIGGGSVIDAGKAISAMLTSPGSVFEYLEDVGRKVPAGSKLPFIAVPTTAGTGSETTKNSVISKVGSGGYKKSLRHDNYIPDIAIIDPELSLTLPFHVTASCGMDAFSQLIESYLSTAANPITDALALSGIACVRNSLLDVSLREPHNIGKRGMMAYASMVSGITLANAGLGVVHGIAGVLGGLFHIPHGAACGTILSESMRITIKKLREHADDNRQHLDKIAGVGKLLAGCDRDDADYCCDKLAEVLDEWTEVLKMPGLGEFGIAEDDIPRIVALSSNKNNPVKLNDDEIAEILRRRM